MANTQINIGANGTKTLATAGKYCDRNIDVNVSVPVGITPSGTKNITTNGTHDVTNYASANVNVTVPSGYIKPSGSKTITENGTHDVTSYASAVVNVPTGGSDNYHVIPLTLSATGGSAAVMPTILSGNEFVKANCSKVSFYAMLIPLNAADTLHGSNYVPFIYAGNRAIVNSKTVGYTIYAISTGETAYASGRVNNYKVSQNGYNVTLRANSSGNIILYVAANYTVPAGNYLLILGLAE